MLYSPVAKSMLKGLLSLRKKPQSLRISGGIRAWIKGCFVRFARQNFMDAERGNGVDR